MAELLHHLGINWKLLIIQMVNFGILLFVLRRFIYQPVLNAIKLRKEQSEKAFEKSQELEEKIIQIEQTKEHLLGEARKQSHAILQKAEVAAGKISTDALAKSQKEIERFVAETKSKAQSERLELLLSVKKEIGGLVAEAVTATLSKKGGISTDTSHALTEEAAGHSL
jgi:F-type H+-transporting ATPase subunit b